ncbi:hypothetical protein Q670_16260 [Alcanivorax sp. P2S70]|nr:hypothetical protein Q670_16260 [Alcanivorax sp. P2S70]
MSNSFLIVFVTLWHIYKKSIRQADMEPDIKARNGAAEDREESVYSMEPMRFAAK